jgi:tRNA (guanine37-N1)-methyltransferase
MIIDVLTLFPEMFTPVTEQSILGRAVENGILSIRLINIRDYTLDRHNRTDDTPFGGGAGMVMSADPLFRSLEAAEAGGKRLLYMSPKGRLLDQSLVRELSEEKEIVILCGHYEGIDQRVIDYWNPEEVTIGDYILTGGELPAMVLIDSVARMIQGVLGSSEANDEESVYSGLLEYPHYTKPREYRGLSVPDVLVSGNHRSIRLWRFAEALRLTRQRRPDLFFAFIENAGALSKDEKKILEEILGSTQY